MARTGGRWQEPNSLIGSAMRLAGRVPTPLELPKPESWQESAWQFYDEIGEVRFAANWIGNALSRVRLYAARVEGFGDTPTPLDQPAHPAVQAVQQFAGGPAGQAETLSTLGIQLSVPGDCYLIGQPDADGDLLGGTWLVASALDLRKSGGGYVLSLGGSQKRTLHPDSLVTRVWKAHPRHRWEADSPTRAALPILSEMRMLSAHIYATAQSRLAGAGVLAVPTEATFPHDPQHANAQDPFMTELGATMMEAIRDQGSPSAVVPIVVRLPGEYVDKIKHLTFSTPFDERVLSLREAAIRRYAATVDMPAEVLLGMGDSNHWSAWQISESALTLHIEPMMALLCNLLTEHYLHPVLDAMRVDTTGLVVWYDASELALRPDRAQDARDLYDRLLVSATTTRREAGFDEADAPTQEELGRQVLLKVMTSAPSLAPLLLPALGIDVNLTPEAEQVLVDAPAPGDGSAPGAGDVPAAGPPERAALVEACDGVVHRTLERAGARLRSVGGTDVRAATANVEADAAHVAVGGVADPVVLDDLLRHALARVPEVALRHGVDPTALGSLLRGYCAALLTAGRAHTYDDLDGVLAAWLASD